MLKTARTTLRPVAFANLSQLFAFYEKNKTHLQPWENLPESFAKLETKLKQELKAQEEKRAAYLLVFDGEILIGMCNFTSMIFGAFQACFLGYKIDKDYQGKVYMREALDAAIAYVFKTFGLHRIMANYIPENKRSEKLLKSLGFEKEGLAKDYLFINGKWRDHILTSLIQPIA